MQRARWHHVLNGDATRASLERAGLPGTIAVWAETLHEGPVRGREPRTVWRAERARFYDSLGPPPAGQPAARVLLERWDRGLLPDAPVDEVILWLEHDLFDQLCLLHHLEHYTRCDLGDATLSLVCIGEHPALPRFLGLGQLSPDQLAALADTRQRVTPAQTALGVRAWRAFCGEDPTELAALLHGEDLGALPFLAAALRRFFEEYPSPEAGLPRTERQVLEGLRDGPASVAALFRHNQDCEQSPFLGDLLFFAVLRRLAGGAHPLLRLDGQGPIAEQRATLEPAGARVLDGDGDAVALNGVDLWRGGVHLRGREGIWRWDARGDTLLRR